MSKKINIVIILSFITSILITFYSIKKFDRYELDGVDHYIVKGDISKIWIEGEKFKTDLLEGNNFLLSGSEIYRSYLPPRLIGLFSIVFDYDLIDNHDPTIEKISLGFKKFYYIFIQNIIYYLILFFLYKKLVKDIIQKNTLFYIVLFLSFCPNIFLYNSTFYTESFFFSLQLLLLILLIEPSKKIIDNFIIGIVISLIFLQKTLGVFYISLVVVYLYFSYKEYRIRNIIIISLTYACVLFAIGFSNLKRAGIFYVLPTQGNEAIFHYLANPIETQGAGINDYEAYENFNERYQKWKIENKINDENLEKNRVKIGKFKKKYTFELIKEYPITSLKIIIWKSLQTVLLMNPINTFENLIYEQDDSVSTPYYLDKDYLKFWIPIKLIYSLIINIIILFGFFSSFKYLNLRLNLFIIFSALYMFFMLAWVGNSRYYSTSLIYLSFYFGFGVNFLINFIRFKKLNFNA